MSIVFENVKDLDLKETLDCGQCFRWKELEDGSFFGVVRGRAARAYMDGGSLILDGADEADREMWFDYFDLGLDYGAVREQLSRVHPVMAEAARFAPGIRILRQEPFEALISFIISQNNNIKRISGIVERLCEGFGEPIRMGEACSSRTEACPDISGEDVYYRFPTAERLSALTPDDLAPIRAGFRHRYIIDGAQKVCGSEIDLEALRDIPYDDAKRELMKITGVGVKVADCTLLYGLHRLDGFPLDVWMKRAMAVLFDGMDPSEFGEYAGIAQQYIFHYSRMNPGLFE